MVPRGITIKDRTISVSTEVRYVYIERQDTSYDRTIYVTE